MASVYGSAGASYVYNYIPELLRKEDPFKFSSLEKAEDVVISGTSCYTLKGSRLGDPEFLFTLVIAKDTFLLRQVSWSVIMGQKQRRTMIQDIAKNDARVAKRMSSIDMPDIQLAWVLTYSAISVNPSLDNSVFEMSTNTPPIRPMTSEPEEAPHSPSSKDGGTSKTHRQPE